MPWNANLGSAKPISLKNTKLSVSPQSIKATYLIASYWLHGHDPIQTSGVYHVIKRRVSRSDTAPTDATALPLYYPSSSDSFIEIGGGGSPMVDNKNTVV
ncbi:hypothetical protein N7537_006826 [Penicillium hordei]|uniref:Uncharacterized protein n=1 Tax=Penicillium hordei TaxID=40994 RepID=A0AAD6E893_9EURO|nr:uncharacterized protein N7537_006826 [Penicillium hordei]KAJ5603870.1 hypothetical protein N7537_006826 [Penicillium hordei]